MNTQDKPKVSVIIPTYNRAPLLKKALESVRSQTFNNWEAIVADEFSEDDTDCVVNSFEDPRIKLIKFRSGGILAAARNEGIRNARAPLIAFLDSDDSWYPSKLARCLDAMKPGVDLVSHGVAYVRNGHVWKRHFCGPKERATYEKLLYQGNCLITSTVVVRRESLERVSGFYETPIDVIGKKRPEKREDFVKDPVHVGSEDYDLWLRLAKDGARFEFLNEILGEYSFHSENATHSVTSIIKSHLAVLDRHWKDISNGSLRERRRRQKVIASVYYSAARSLQDEGKKKEALQLYWKAARVYPFYFKLFPASFLTFCGWPRR